MNSTDDMACKARASIYALLANVFGSHPTPESVGAVRQMAETLEISCPNGWSLTDLDSEYMELFVAPNPRYVAPYESVFRDSWLLPVASRNGSGPKATSVMIKGLVMGESTLEVRQCYLQVGVLPGNDLPDHIANELRFMSYLWASEAESSSLEAGVLAGFRAKFRDEHILKWLGQLRERLAESDHLGHYLAALKVAEVVLEIDDR